MAGQVSDLRRVGVGGRASGPRPEASRARRGQRSPPPARITEIRTEQETRLATGFEEVDRVLGGGLVTDSAVLIGGEPGIGKSTLMTMLGYRLARTGHTVLYITGEESLSQVRLRAERLEALDERFWLAAETDLHTLLGHVEQTAPSVCIVDSIQTVHCPEVNGGPGTVTQVRETAGRLVACTKEHGVALLLVGHVTKDGSLAGAAHTSNTWWTWCSASTATATTPSSLAPRA